MDGDKVLILKQSTMNRSGEIGAIIYDGDMATLKKIEYVDGEDWVKLIPINPEYTPKTIETRTWSNAMFLAFPACWFARSSSKKSRIKPIYYFDIPQSCDMNIFIFRGENRK